MEEERKGGEEGKKGKRGRKKGKKGGRRIDIPDFRDVVASLMTIIITKILRSMFHCIFHFNYEPLCLKETGV